MPLAHADKHAMFLAYASLLGTLLYLGLAVGTAWAGMTSKAAWDAMLYVYPSWLSTTKDSVLNPGNRVAALSNSSWMGEARLNVRLEDDRFRLTLRPLLSIPQEADGVSHPQGYLSQWQARAVLSPTWTASLGREVMNWGPSQFRSPASPFYFDNGRSNPLRELSGVDAAKLSWIPNRSRSLSMAYLQGSGHEAGRASPDPWRHTWLLHGDLRGDDWAGGLVLAQPQCRSLFVGTHLQWTVNDAWLIYGEASSSRLPNALVSPADLGLPFALQAESSRQSIGLIGATVTLENGQSLSGEWLRDNHGYPPPESQSYFARAATNMASAGLALAEAPPLLNRNYLHLVWQNNLLDGDDYWRFMFTRNLDDDSSAIAGYFEQPLDNRLVLFVMGVVNVGGPRREWSSLIENSLTLGLRLALP